MNVDENLLTVVGKEGRSHEGRLIVKMLPCGGCCEIYRVTHSGLSDWGLELIPDVFVSPIVVKENLDGGISLVKKALPG